MNSPESDINFDDWLRDVLRPDSTLQAPPHIWSQILHEVHPTASRWHKFHAWSHNFRGRYARSSKLTAGMTESRLPPSPFITVMIRQMLELRLIY